MLNPKNLANGQEQQELKKQKSRYGKENTMSEIEKLYEAYTHRPRRERPSR